MKVRIAIVGIALTLSAGVCHAESSSWIPVVAKERFVQTRVSADGSQKVLSETYGQYLRSSSGKVLITTNCAKEGGNPTKATYMDMASGALYSLSYTSKTARLIYPGPADKPKLTPEYIARAKSGVGRADR